MDVYEMSAREIFETFVKHTDPEEVLEMDRATIAGQLMVDGGLDQESAYFAADQILAFAAQLDDAATGT